jgi:UDP-N-acetylglucosamine 2-epimerase (non-hydrolysing)
LFPLLEYEGIVMIFLVAGARPNFMKISPIARKLKKENLPHKIIHTGQHYDIQMSEAFFKDLAIPEPDINLGIGSGSHAEQTGKVMMEFEKVCFEKRPDLVVVVGDVNSTIACALAAAKLLIPVAHVEAGLRSFDMTMPEEINRLLTDQISDFLFTTCKDANVNLRNEGIPENKIFFVGNVMIDTLLGQMEKAQKSDILRRLGLTDHNKVKRFALVTLHRPSNVDDTEILGRILLVLLDFLGQLPVIFSIHPRTLRRLRKFGLMKMIDYREQMSLNRKNSGSPKIVGLPPLGYHDFLCLMGNATIVLTDSGGIQEETTILGIPCLTLRKNTERPITVREGTNVVVGNDPDAIKSHLSKALGRRNPRKKMPALWDGKAAERIVSVLKRQLVKEERYDA